MKGASLANEDEDSQQTQVAMVSSVQEATAYLAAEMDHNELQKAGLQIEELFLGCTYNGVKCALNEMKSFTDKRYGNCFTFNWNGSHYIERHGQNMGKDVYLLGTWSLCCRLLALPRKRFNEKNSFLCVFECQVS